MNAKERTVLLFLIAVLLVGCGVNIVRRARRQAQLKAIVIAHAADSASSAPRFGAVGEESFPRFARNQEPGTENRINLNTATAAELDLLPGIGPALSQRIIDYRTTHNGFGNKEELLDVSGIGPKKYAAIKDRITVSQKR